MVKIEFDEEDKKALERFVFIVQDGVISFPKGASYPIKRLEKIIEEAKKMKSKSNQILCGIMIRFPYSLKRKSKTKKGGKKK